MQYHEVVVVQWTPSNPAILGTIQSVLIKGMASLFALRKHILKASTGVASFLESGVYCIDFIPFPSILCKCNGPVSC